MSSRLLFLAGWVACIGAGCQGPEGISLTLSFPDFKPGCVRMTLQDAGDAGKTRSQDIREELATKSPGGQLRVAVLRPEGWSRNVSITAMAFEQTCGVGPAFTTQTKASLGPSVISVELKFEAVDKDQDGYVSRASGGTDCRDDDPKVNPGQVELCNDRDDNCDSRADEGFERVGQQCGTLGTCRNWVCNAEGGLVCQEGALRWYRDQDGDGEGTAQDVRESCTQPSGYVLNSRDCDDTRKERYSTAQELCNGVNDNCDAVIDEGFNVGSPCTEGSCTGKVECTTATQSTCRAVTSTWYPDGDEDTHGKKDAARTFCGTAQPPGYVASSDDCDDTRANVYPGASELCDEVDNNCDNRVDENFDVGAICNAADDCAGKKACAASGTTTECKATVPTQYYVDNDQDGYGQSLGPKTCTPQTGYTAQGGDCQDGNRFVYPGAPELCDGEDNDCNSSTGEASVCPQGGATWRNYSSAVGDSWRSVALYGNGGAWFAGGDKLHLRKPGQSTFDDLSASCSTGENAWAVAANPITGDAVLGGDGGFLARASPATNSCTDKGKKAISTDVRGVHLVPVQGQSLLENYFVGRNTDTGSTGGRAVRVFDNMATGYDNDTVATALKDVNGPSRDTLFAVGEPGISSPNSSIYRFNASTGNWVQESVPGSETLLGVWVVHSKLAYAVGDNGTLLTWNGTAWSKVTGVPAENFSAVVAFGSQSIYVTTLTGRLYYFNGAWMEIFRTPAAPPDTNAQLLDVAANNPGDIWIVGSKGARYHWPR